MFSYLRTRLIGAGEIGTVADRGMVGPENQKSFVARIWLEGSDQAPTWRGHLRHVHGDEECYFQNFTTMKEFLERISGVPFPMKDEVDDEDK